MHEDTDMEGKVPDTKDLDADEYGESKGKSISGVSKDALKAAMREVNMEDRLKYTVDCRNVEELEMIIKLAKDKITELKKNPKGKNNTDVAPSKY